MSPYPIEGYSNLATDRPQGGVGDKTAGTGLWAGEIDVQDIQPGFLQRLNQAAVNLGKTFDIISGYRSDEYSDAVGGFGGDPHSQGRAVDARITNGAGVFVGDYKGAVAEFHSLGLRSGATDFTYGTNPDGTAKTDDEHVDTGGPGFAGIAQYGTPNQNLTDTPGIGADNGSAIDRGTTSLGTSQPGVPTELADAITAAGGNHGIPVDLLDGIWQIESGGNFPNPYVNKSSGYGGLFGTSNWNDTTENQADTAASILASAIANNKGDIAKGLYTYSGGAPNGYTSVPGETTFGNLSNPTVNGSSSGIGGNTVTGGGASGNVGKGGGLFAGLVSGAETLGEYAVDPLGVLGISGSGIAGAVLQPVEKGALALAAPFIAIYNTLTNQNTWIRVGFFVGGIVLVIGGLLLAFK